MRGRSNLHVFSKSCDCKEGGIRLDFKRHKHILCKFSVALLQCSQLKRTQHAQRDLSFECCRGLCDSSCVCDVHTEHSNTLRHSLFPYIPCLPFPTDHHCALLLKSSLLMGTLRPKPLHFAKTAIMRQQFCSTMERLKPDPKPPQLPWSVLHRETWETVDAGTQFKI